VKTTAKAHLLRSTLFAALTAAPGLSFVAYAQDTVATTSAQPAAETQDGDVVVITGSRLRSEALDNPNPTFEVGAEQIDSRQVANVVDVLEDLPIVGVGTNARGTQVQNGDSFAFPDVLDLGTQRTLTLLNGRRIVPSNPGSVFVPGNASGSQVDLTSINPQMLERVDVLAGTGGAIYGADAVGGVVNLITRTDYEGLELRAQAGVSEYGDGENYRLSALYGTDIMNGQGNIVASLDYSSSDLVRSSADNGSRYQGSGILNPYEGSVRNPAAFNAQTAVSTLLAGGTLPAAFLPQGSDGVPATYFGPLALSNPLTSAGGTLVTGQLFGGGFSTATNLIPVGAIHGSLAAGGANPTSAFSVFAPTTLPTGVVASSVISTLAPGTNTAGLSATQLNTLAIALLQRNRPTPQEYFAQNPNTNPLLFMGTFGTYRTDTGAFNGANGYMTTIANTNPATSAIFPRVAVPLAFDSSGNLVSYNPGQLSPTLPGRIGSMYNGAGYDSFGLGDTQYQAGNERFSAALNGHYDISEGLRYRSTLMYTKNEFEQSAGAVANTVGGSAQAGAQSIPIYIDQNPYVTASSLATINQLEANGLVIPRIGGPSGQRVLYMGRALRDVLGGTGTKSTFDVENYQIIQSLEGDFEVGASDFYWDVAASYGRSEQESKRPDLLDTEFALATDVVRNGSGQAVCRQQTLPTPERINIRNPGTGAVVTTTGLTPSAAQVAACRPLNLFGDGNGALDPAAVDYVVGTANVHALNSLEYYSASLGSDLFDVPAGAFQVGFQAEYRKESAEFEPAPDTQIGAGRTAPQGRGEGSLEFREYGVEAKLPVFGGNFTFPGAEELELGYALRIVEREQDSSTVVITGTGTKDDTFNYYMRWKPIDDLTIRAANSRTVRSASLVELVGPFTVAFTGLTSANHPCTTAQIGLGPNPTNRRANCVAAVQRLGIAPDATSATAFLAGFTAVGGTVPANAGGNPGLSNEEGNTYTLGFTFEPSFIPRLVIAVDYFNVDITNEIGLVGPATFAEPCFDGAPSDFGNAVVGGYRACEAILFGTPTGPGGQFVVPTNNAISGNPGIAGVLAGAPATNQVPFEIAFAAFSNLNLGKREFRGVNAEIRYNFDLNEVPLVGGMMQDWGGIDLRASYFHTQRYDIYGNGVTRTDRLAGEHSNPEHEFRLDTRHTVGPFSHTLSSLYTSATVSNVLTTKNLIPEQTPAFVADDFWFFNYNAAFDLNDNYQLRLTINNLFDQEEPRGVYGIGNNIDGGFGREYIVGVTAKF
jgi:outer membrane receptor protein involved in Fe transport